MVDLAEGSSSDPGAISQAFTAVQGLLQRAEHDAAHIRAEADRYVARREQEAELIVAKARRVLGVAENTAAAIVAQARTDVVTGASSLVRRGRFESTMIDLDDPALSAPAEQENGASSTSADGPPHTNSGLDRMLASAIAKAVDRAFPAPRG